MPVCCICGKKTLNCFIKDRKAYCKSCLKTAGMDSGAIMSKKLMRASEEEIRSAVSSGVSHKTQDAPTPIAEFKGTLGKIELYADKIVIKRGVLHASGRSQKEIYLSSITAIQIKKPGLQAGYIQFVLSGSQEVKKSSTFGMEIANDENSVIFNDKAKYDEAMAFKNKVEKVMHESHQPTVIVQGQMSIADELSKLKSLVDAGILTEDEFAQQKQKLLSK